MCVVSQPNRKIGLKQMAPFLAVVSLSIITLLTASQVRIHVPHSAVSNQRVTYAPPSPPGRHNTTTYVSKPLLHEKHPEADAVPRSQQGTESSDDSETDEVTSEEYPQHEECIIYDRPTRTGSTTISTKLQSCLKERGYHLPKPYPKDGKAGLRMVPRMLRQNASRVGLSSVHIRVLQADVDDMHARCKRILFITSCAPMRERMWSGVKYELGNPSGTKNGNTTIFLSKEEAFRRMLAQERFEDAREAYPFVDVNNKPLMMRRRLIPDYVIRKERMEDDFKLLLEALGCSSEIESRNVHTEEDESVKIVINDVPLKHNDKMYQWLSELAKNNENGLKKARALDPGFPAPLLATERLGSTTNAAISNTQFHQ